MKTIMLFMLALSVFVVLVAWDQRWYGFAVLWAAFAVVFAALLAREILEGEF